MVFKTKKAKEKFFWVQFLNEYLKLRVRGKVSDAKKAKILKDLNIKSPRWKWICYFLSKYIECYFYRIECVFKDLKTIYRERYIVAWFIVIRELLDFSFNYSLKIAKKFKLFPELNLNQLVAISSKAKNSYIKLCNETRKNEIFKIAWNYSVNPDFVKILIHLFPVTYFQYVLKLIPIDMGRYFKDFYLEYKLHSKEEKLKIFKERFQKRTFRTNLLKIENRKKLLEKLKKYNIEVKISKFSESGLYAYGIFDLNEIKEYNEGLFEVQDEASILAVEYIDPFPHKWLLDFCAGYGSKTLAYSACMKNKGQIVASDIYDYKLKELKKRAKKSGCSNIRTMNKKELLENEELKEKFDYVVLDVPCSGTGTIEKNQEIKEYFTRQDLFELRKKQLSILDEAKKFVKKNGFLIYMTCSILKYENEEVVNLFLRHNPDFELTIMPGKEEKFQPFLVGDFFTTRKHLEKMEGIFVAVMRKK